MRIGILQGGGTCPGTNAAISGAQDCAAFAEQRAELLGIPHGYRGLTTSQDLRPVGAWVQSALAEHGTLQEGNRKMLAELPGCILGTSRENPLTNWEESLRNIRENIARNRLDALLVIGGDDTFSVARRLAAENILPVNGIPKTIDFDLTIPSFGFATAAQRGHEFVAHMRTEARNFGIVGVIEAMGRDAGWLARAHQVAADSPSNADIVLLPECEVVEDVVVGRTREIFQREGHAILVVAEGFRIAGKQIYLGTNGELDHHGHRRLGGIRFRIEQWLNAAGLKTYQLAPGYLYRTGQPTQEDQNLAYCLGLKATESLLRGDAGKVAVQETAGSHTITVVPIESVRGGKFVPPELYDAELLRRKD